MERNWEFLHPERTVQSVAARSIVHKFLKRSTAWTKPERVIMGLRLASIS